MFFKFHQEKEIHSPQDHNKVRILHIAYRYTLHDRIYERAIVTNYNGPVKEKKILGIIKKQRTDDENHFQQVELLGLIIFDSREAYRRFIMESE